MIRAIVHHGFVGTAIEYFAVVAGPDVDKRFFFEQIASKRGDVVRYFGGSSEVVLNPEGVRFRGNGGIFGEYMFGGHLPVGDLLNDEVVNRLVLFGTTADPHTHELRFSIDTEGFERWETSSCRAMPSRTTSSSSTIGRNTRMSATGRSRPSRPSASCSSARRKSAPATSSRSRRRSSNSSASRTRRS